MAVLVQDAAAAVMNPDRARAQLRGDLKAEVFTDLKSVEGIWRALEASPGALATPYQRFDWVAAYVEAQAGSEAAAEGAAEGAAQAAALRVVVLRDGADRPRMLLPLIVCRKLGVRVARVIGDKHANLHMPLFASREATTVAPEDVLATLAALGRAAGIDVYALNFQPRFWDGAANPLGAAGHPCPSDAYGLMLGPDAEATVKRAYSGDARKKLRAKERKLVEAHGPIEYRSATSPDQVAAIVETFLRQKAARMAAIGVADPYADARVRRFLELATRPRGEAGPPAIEVHALALKADGRVLATFGGAVDRDRFSGMWTSFDTDPDLGRFSPGDLLLHHLIGKQTEAGRRAFDLGVGEARYKASICDETIELVKTVIPVTPAGQVYAIGEIGLVRAKHRIKRSPRLWAMAQRFRRQRAVGAA